MVFQEAYLRASPPHLLIFRYVIDKKEFHKHAKIHERKSRDDLDDALLRVGWGMKGRNGELCVASQDVSLAYYSRIEGAYRILEYRISKGHHPFLHLHEFANTNV